MRQAVRGILWINLYVMVSVVPLVLALVPARPPSRGFWVEFSVALGFVGLSMLGLQFALTARFHGVVAPYGMDIVLRFHRQISIVAFGFILAHPALLFVTESEMRSLFDPIAAPWRARFGMLAVVLLGVLIVTSLWRIKLGVSYEVWRVSHGILAVAVVAFALAHVEMVGHYVSLPWQRVLWVLMSGALVGLLFWVRVWKPIRLYRRPYRIERVSEEKGDAWTVELEPDDHDGFRFQPGQFAWLIVHHSPLNVVEHPFSFSNSAEQDGRISFTIKELGDFTSTVKDLEPGTRAYVDGPYGVFTHERNEASGFVFIAGGIGITPIMSMLRTLADRGDRRPLLLIYGNPTLEEAAFDRELDELSERLDLRVVHVPEDPPHGWEGESGFVTEELLLRHLDADPNLRSFFVCGPDAMMDAVEAALDQIGVPLDRVQMERFNLV